MIRGSLCSKSRLAKTAGAEVGVPQKHEKWHAAVARSTFASQNVAKLRGSDHFLKLRCRKISQSVSYSQSIIQSVSQSINDLVS